ncbi:hypothetical protein SEA_LOKK_81 [Mycobacterium phage Lokk]|nr:hypothetical protein SEA_LOKK_81 [Mycobacterium phage Lokk]QDF18478.1 hypothetical protein SEA_RACHALY_83 [Mycobacterium Phage Rachaly]QGH78775.1 hypothetical protein SEA_MIKO_81 [Mycobacterium phage Miko]
MKAIILACAFAAGGLIGQHIPVTVNSTEVRTVDGIDYPVCAVEDCSDQPGQIGIWIDPDTGNQWLSHGETSQLIER